jgi:hypothetical protein
MSADGKAESIRRGDDTMPEFVQRINIHTPLTNTGRDE